MPKNIAKKGKKVLKINKIVPIILCSIQLITSIALIIALKRLNLLQLWQLFLVTFVLFALEALNIYKLIISKTARRAVKVTLAIVSIILAIITSFGFRYVNQTVSFIENITGSHNETQTYKVLVLKTARYDNIEQLNQQHIGFLSSNPNIENTKKTLKSKINYKDTDYSELGTLIAGISDYKVSAIVLADSYLEFLEENNQEFIETTKVIYEFEVRIDSEKDIKRVNVATDPFILYI